MDRRRCAADHPHAPFKRRFPEFLFRYYDGLDDFHPELQSLCDSYMDSVFAGLARANSGYTTLRLVFVLLLALVRPLKRRKLSITAGLIASLLWLNTAFYYYMVCVEIFASNKPSIAWYILVSATAAMLIGSLMKD